MERFLNCFRCYWQWNIVGERVQDQKNRNCYKGLLRRFFQDLRGVSGNRGFPGCYSGFCEVFCQDFRGILPGFPRYFARISEVYIKDFRGIIPMFSELFGGFLRTSIFREIHRIIQAPFKAGSGSIRDFHSGFPRCSSRISKVLSLDTLLKGIHWV